MNDQNVTSLSDDEIVDAKNFQEAERATVDPLEKEEAEAAKKTAKKAPKGKYIATTKIICDGKTFMRGDVFDGKLYNDLLSLKALCTKEDWEKR